MWRRRFPGSTGSPWHKLIHHYRRHERDPCRFARMKRPRTSCPTRMPRSLVRRDRGARRRAAVPTRSARAASPRRLLRARDRRGSREERRGGRIAPRARTRRVPTDQPSRDIPAHSGRRAPRLLSLVFLPVPLRKERARALRDRPARRARAVRARPAGRAADGGVGRHHRASRACDRRAGCPVRRRSRRASRRSRSR